MLYWQWRQPYSVCSSRQGSPLDGGPTVTAVVPQDDLPRVSPPHHQVGMKPGKTHRYYRRLRKERERERRGEDETAELLYIIPVWRYFMGENFIMTWQNKEHGEKLNGLVGWTVEIKQQTVRKSKNKERYEAKTITLDGAWVRMRDQGSVMGGRRGEIDGDGDDELGYGEGLLRREGWRWGGDQTKRGIVVPLSPSRFTLQHQNPSSHWSAHCSLHHDKRTLELPPSPMQCLLSFGSSSVLVP